MANSDLVKYFKTHLIEAKESINDILGAVRKSGWSEVEIDAALRELGIAKEEPQIAPVAPVKPPTVPVTKNSKTILLIDDEQDFLDIFGTKLSAAGFNVVTALGAEKGFAKMKETKPDLILLDVQMPGMDGVEAIIKIKSNPETAKARVAFLTNYGEPLPVKELLENDKKFAQEIGAVDYIKKSDNLDEVVKKIQGIVAKTSSR